MLAQGFEGGTGSADGAQSRYVAAAAALRRVSKDEGEEGVRHGLVLWERVGVAHADIAAAAPRRRGKCSQGRRWIA